MPLQAGAVVTHHAAALGGRKVVGKPGAPEEADVGEKQINGFGDEGVDKETIVLLRLGEAHFVHVVPASEEAALEPGHQQAEEAVRISPQCADSQDDFLNEDAGEDCLVHQHRGESLAVLSQEFLQESCAAAGWGDDENGAANLLAPEGGKENMIQGPPDGHHHPKAGQKQHEEGHNQPAAQAEGLSQKGVEKSPGS